MALVHPLVPDPAQPAPLARADLLAPVDLVRCSTRSRNLDRVSRAPGDAPLSTCASHGTDAAAWDIVDEWGYQSFPASDPPANW
jgi:hypothetical protein